MSKDNGGPAFPFDQTVYSAESERLTPSYGLSKREYAAIKLRVPDSGTDWLDDMIRTSNRNELAARAMQCLVAGWITKSQYPSTNAEVAEDAFAQAKAMLAQGKIS